MTDPTLPALKPTPCPHPDCDVIIHDGESTIHVGGACPEHADWFALSVAGLNAGDIGAIEVALSADPDGRHPELVPGCEPLGSHGYGDLAALRQTRAGLYPNDDQI